MKRIALCLLFVVMLTTCATPQTVEPTSTLEAPAVTATLPPATEIPFTALSPEEQVAKFLSGEITNISTLNLDQHAAFSLAYTEKLDANAPIVSFNNKEAYINPDSLEMLQYADGVSEADKKFETFVAVKEDADGNLSFFDADSGEYVLIPGSKGMDWRMIVDDQEDTGITWPTTKKFINEFTNGREMTFPEIMLSQATPDAAANKFFFTPVVLLNKTTGNIFLDIGMGEDNLRNTGLMTFGKPILDANDTVIAIEEFFVIPDSNINFYAEGESWEGTTPGWLIHPKNVREHLGEFGIYYIGLKGKQGAWLKDLNAQAFPQVAFGNEAIALVKDGKSSKNKVPLVEIKFVIKKNP